MKMFLLPLLALAQASPHFPRQPSLPPSVLLSIVEEDTETFTRAQLARLARLNNSLTSSRQTDSAYFEGDILLTEDQKRLVKEEEIDHLDHNKVNSVGGRFEEGAEERGDLNVWTDRLSDAANCVDMVCPRGGAGFTLS